MGAYFSEAGIFIIDFIFDLFILAVLLRFMFQLLHVNFYNPVSQFLLVITNPLLQPLRRIIPAYRNIDSASVFLLIVLASVKITLIRLIANQHIAFMGLLITSIAEILSLCIYTVMFLVFIRVIMSWFNPYGHRHPLGDILFSVTEPVMQPFKRWIPPVAGLDISPLALFFFLGLTLILIVQPLYRYGAILMH